MFSKPFCWFGMWTCPLVFCDFEKFAQKCLFVLAAADFPCMSAFHVSSAWSCRMENGVHPSQIRFKPCNEMHLVFRFSHPAHPVCLGLLPMPPCRLQPGQSCIRMAFCNLSFLRVCIWLLLFHQPVVWAAFCFQPQLPEKFHLALPCILCRTDVMHFSPSLRSAGPFCKLAAVASQSALSSHYVRMYSLFLAHTHTCLYL